MNFSVQELIQHCYLWPKNNSEHSSLMLLAYLRLEVTELLSNMKTKITTSIDVSLLRSGGGSHLFYWVHQKDLTSISGPLSKGRKKVDVSHPLTWGWKQIQFPKHSVLLCCLEYWKMNKNPVILRLLFIRVFKMKVTMWDKNSREETEWFCFTMTHIMY
jgi:hypothetical protein